MSVSLNGIFVESHHQTFANRMKIWRFVEISLAIAICHQIVHGVRLIPKNATDNTLKYSEFAYSAYSSLHFTNNSTLVFRFKTLKKHGMLFYMDDGGVKEFIDAFLLNGQLRIRVSMGNCREKRFINGSFTDLSWHRITLKRTSDRVMFAVDSHNTSYKLCTRVRKTDFKKHGPLYVSYFPSEEWGHLKWTFRDSLFISLKHGG